MKKIIFYTDSLIMGGAEKIALDYVKMLDETEEFDITLLINEDNGEENILLDKIPKNVSYQFVVEKEIMKKLNFYRRKKQKNFIYKIPYNYYLAKRREKRKNIIDIISKMSYDYIIDFYNILPESIVDERVISWQHMTIKEYPNKNLNSFEKRLSRMKYLVVLNEEMKKEILDKFPKYKEKIKVIYNFFDIDEIKKFSLDDSKLNDKEKCLIKENYFFACCRIDKQKDIDTLVESYKILKEKYNIKEKLYIAGVGDQKERLENLVKSYQLEKDVVFLGLQKNPYIWMKNARFFVHSSHREGFGMVLVEALITNGMVISSDCPVGPKEILENGRSGILFPVGDKNKLVEEIQKILTDKKIIENYKNESRRRKKDFSKEKVQRQVIDLFKGEI